MTDDWSAHLAVAEATLTKALSLAPNHAFAHLYLGFVQNSTKRVAQGIAQCERALALDRNLAGAHALIGDRQVLLVEPQKLNLTSTRHSAFLLATPCRSMDGRVGLAKAQLDADAEAVVWLRRGLEANRNYSAAHFLLAAVLARLGELDEARAAAQAGLALDPSFTIRRYRNGAPSDNPTYLASQERVYQGMRLAGVPEE